MIPVRLSALALAIAAASVVHADVFEVGADGAVIARSGPGAVSPAGPDMADEGADNVADTSPDVPAPALTLLAAPDAPAAYQPTLIQAATRYDVSPALLAAVVWQESRWQPTALSAKGAIGLAQLMPATARALAVDPHEPAANLQGAAHYLRQLLDLFDGDVERTLAAYNAGPQRVLKAGGIPAIAETRSYVARIIDRLSPASSTGVIK